MHNNLFLNRLLIYTHSGEVAYDEIFHRGVNIIAGDNSSGKSTITHFIFYILGGAFNDWVKEAKRCSMVIGEVTMNGITITLRREININQDTNKANAQEPIYIYWGDYSTSLKAQPMDWERYGYSTTPVRKSFSNVFFDNLDIPIVKGDSNITFHQLLRLMYVDQDSPTSSLFLYEQFDTTLTRETVSDLLLGVYDQNLYDNRQRLIEVTHELDDIKKEIKVIKQFVPSELDLNPANINLRIRNKQNAINDLELELIRLKEEDKTVRFTTKTRLEFEKINDAAILSRSNVAKLEDAVSALKFEIDDTKYFISALENKAKAIKNSILTREFLGEFPLDYCPECLNLLKVPEGSVCKLCKEPSDNTFGVAQAKRIELEIGFQISESKTIIAKRERDLVETRIKYDAERLALHHIQVQVNAALKDVKSTRDERIDTLYIDKGVYEGELNQLRTLLETADLFNNLQGRMVELDREKVSLISTIERVKAKQDQTKHLVNEAIEKKGLYLLNNDLKRQDDFIAAKEFNIDYGNNLAFISDKEAKYSASSNFYLKTSARYAIFLASLEMDQMRYPRFILCDNMEDKGIEGIRAQNFQKIIIEEAEKHDKEDFQIIYTTSFLSSELLGTEYIVGEFYTKEAPSLKNVQSSSNNTLLF